MKSWLFSAEPALWCSALAAVLGVGAALALPGLSTGQVALIMALVNAVLGAIQAAVTRPIGPSAFTTLVGAVAALAAGYGFHVSPAVLAGVDGVVLAVLPLLVRHQVTPVAKLRAAALAVVPESPHAEGSH